MSESNLDLLPAEVRTRVKHGRLSRRLMAAASACTALALGVSLAGVWIERHSSETLRWARSQAAQAIAIEDEIRQIELQRRVARDLLEQQRLLAVTVPASGVIQAVAAALPEGALLEKIDLDYRNVQGEARKGRRAAKAQADPRELYGEVAGIAVTDGDVGAIVDALGKVAPLSNVSLESSRSREFRGKSAREFRITFRVDLERRWRMPSMAADAVTSMENHP